MEKAFVVHVWLKVKIYFNTIYFRTFFSILFLLTSLRKLFLNLPQNREVRNNLPHLRDVNVGYFGER